MCKGSKKICLFIAILSLFLLVGCQNTEIKKSKNPQKQTQKCQNHTSSFCSKCAIDSSECLTQSCRIGAHTKK